MTNDPSNDGSAGRDAAGRFVRGNGHGRGRTAGSRNNASLALDELAASEAEGVLRATLAAAVAGDMQAANLILTRIWPARRGRPVRIDLPPIETAADVSRALTALLAGVSEGTITPDEAATVAGLLDLQRRAIETHDLEARIEALEEEEVARHEVDGIDYGAASGWK